MRTVKFVVLSILLAVGCASETRAWNCSNPLAERVLVPSTTTGTYGDADGQLANYNGQLYVCKVVPVTPPAPTPTPSSQPQTQSQQQSSSNSATSASNSASNSQASSNSTSTGGTSSSNASGGNANVSSSNNATGGNATGGNSTVSKSGNSSNRNTNLATGGNGGNSSSNATGGQGGASTSNSAATNNGNNANNSSSTYSPTTNTTVEASKVPVSSAYATPPLPTVTCFKGYGVSGQSMTFGLSVGGGKIDEHCAILETARQAPNKLARCLVFITDKYAKAAGVTLEKCMQEDLVPAPAPAVPVAQAPPAAPQIVVVPVPAYAPPETQPTLTHETRLNLIPLGSCPVNHVNVCNRLIDSALVYLTQDPNNEISVHGPLAFTAPILAYVKARGFSASRVRLSLDDVNTFDIGVVVSAR